jgi:hypothetical protein
MNKARFAAMPATGPGFFVGYINGVPKDGRGLLWLAGVFLIAGFALLGAVLGGSNPSPGDGRFVGEITVTGVMERFPYPVLRLPPDAENRQGRVLLLAGEDKTGVQAKGEELAGRTVTVQGYLTMRGTLEMILVNAATAFSPAPAGETRALPAAVPLGRWRMEGEICDGKCYAGAMQPGTGLSHKACANLCLSGGVPPVFVTEKPVEGRNFFLLADAAGGPVPPVMFDYTAQPVVLEGELVRIGDLIVFRADWTRVKLP